MDVQKRPTLDWAGVSPDLAERTEANNGGPSRYGRQPWDIKDLENIT